MLLEDVLDTSHVRAESVLIGSPATITLLLPLPLTLLRLVLASASFDSP
jgi:hypothetical protein